MRERVPYLFFPLVVIFDQLSKGIAITFAKTTCNTGVALGFLQNLPVIIPITILAGLAYLLKKENQTERKIAYCLILGGGVSNLIDRIARGCVVDFIDLKMWPSLTWLSPSLTRWPRFNLADSVITIGVLILVYKLFMDVREINRT